MYFSAFLLFAQASADHPGNLYTKEPVTTPAVVGAVLRIGSWLDMTTQVGLREFRQVYEDLVTATSSVGIRLPTNEPAGDDDADVILRQLDKAVFDLLHHKREEQDEPAYDAVCGAFQQGEPIAASSAFKARSHVQIALVNPDCVVSRFLVPGDRLMTPQAFAQAQQRLAEAQATTRKPRRLAASQKTKPTPP